MKIRRLIGSILLAGFTVSVSPFVADGDTGAPPASRPTPPRFGPFEALTFDRSVLQDVKFENNRIYLKRQPNHCEGAIVLRNSMANGDAYRLWLNGSRELVSPANAGRALNAWTDWVETTATYVEYWMGDQLILHLHRISS
ncbi:MAG: hypothetical protein J6386_12850 [Candidatus Synoicihabitans palmerolidicus]|nr:hypothetical protein [Candidatus Synoicihabitans palmerolidicus]